MLWLKKPVLWHSSRVPSGYDYAKMTPGERLLIRERFHDWYSADWDYALTTVYLFCAVIGLVALVRWASIFRPRKTNAPAGIVDKLVAVGGFLVTKQFRLAAFNYDSPPLAAMGAVVGLFVFTMALMLAVKPYYWPNHEMGHSPPIATRSGWISIAIMPFMIAFATKINFIGLLARTSHERLQVFHRWSATIMYITSLVHTFPFIINNIDMGMMRAEWKTSSYYWTGVVALIPQTYLVACSWGYFRNGYYETFKKLHFVAAGLFMAALFVHCCFRLTSWDYFWATLALYGTAWITRLVRGLVTPGTATLEGLPDRTLLARVSTSRRFTWAPGQHVFVRFMLGPVHFATTHPFTVSNCHSAGGSLELIMRVRDGITQELYRRAAAGGAVRVFVDGPYGHATLARDLRAYDRVLFLAGGSGATFTLPLLVDLVTNGRAEATIEFVVAVRESGSLEWIDRQLRDLKGAEPPRVAITTYITRGTSVSEKDGDAPDVASRHEDEGRPDLAALIRNACSGAAARVAIIACGPDEFAYDVRRAVAAEQLRVACGEASAVEVYLHAENYSW
ncbi:hypothetical protein AURDEDRAFT_106480 [Auricularia subglabra TFB-10046 SS5]|uniref:ferric-chelate reductase (NADPH) n=1 Tax=Auricularia subglabra (strain TFB-10046 / SS5) TaxID=717982 RepID=J0D2J5_AURST|nr:hypothetical protein AURDEDRAFT_106480 [Auricularia subglabra TFB-10046 SS5]